MRYYAPTAFRSGGVDYPQGWLDLPQALGDTLKAAGNVVSDVPDDGNAGSPQNAKVQWGAHAGRPAASAAYYGVIWISQDLDGGQPFYCDGVSWLDLAAFVSAGQEPLVDLTASQTLDATHNRALIRVTSASTVTLTIPAGMPPGFKFRAMQCSSGKVTIAGSGGAAVNAIGAKTSTQAQYGVIDVLQTPTADAYVVGGQSGT